MTEDKHRLVRLGPLPTRADYLRRTLEIVTVEEWGAVVDTALKLAQAGDQQARTWLSHQVGMGQAAQVHVTIQSRLEASQSRPAVTAESLRRLSTEDLQAMAQLARERYGRADVEPLDADGPKTLKA